MLIVANAGVGALRLLIATVLMAGHTGRAFRVLLAPLSARYFPFGAHGLGFFGCIR